MYNLFKKIWRFWLLATSLYLVVIISMFLLYLPSTINYPTNIQNEKYVSQINSEISNAVKTKPSINLPNVLNTPTKKNKKEIEVNEKNIPRLNYFNIDKFNALSMEHKVEAGSNCIKAPYMV